MESALPYDSNGNFSLPAGSIVSTGQKVLPSQHNPPLQDIATNGLSSVLLRDGRAPMTGNLPMGGNKITGMADGTDPADAATVGQAAYAIGDFKDSARNLGEKWLRRNGGLYNSADYPALAAVLPALPDGVEWGNVSTPASGTVNSIITTPSGYMAINDDGTNTRILTSTDGNTWTQTATINAFRGKSVARGSGIYVAVDGNGYVSRSNDGLVWSTPVLISASTDGYNQIIFAAGLFVAVGGGSGGGSKIATSPDGIAWTQRTPGVTAFCLCVVFASGIFVVGTTTGTIATSPDGITWTARTTGVSQSLEGVVWGNALFVAVGANGTIITSPDGIIWTTRSSGTTLQLNAVVYSTAGYLIVGSSGVARISTNGTTWTATATGVGNILYAAVVDPTNTARYIVAGSGSNFLIGVRTLPTQFKTPNDSPTYGWIRAKV